MSTRNKPRKRGAATRRSPLPLVLMLGGVVLIAIVAAWGLSGNRAGSGGTPRLEIANMEPSPDAYVDGLKVDFGDMKLGSQNATLIVRLTNTGDGALRFEQEPFVEIAAGCWPPEPAIGTMALGPGESTNVQVAFTMHDDMGGFHDFRLHLPTNDPSNPDTVITILSNWVE